MFYRVMHVFGCAHWTMKSREEVQVNIEWDDNWNSNAACKDTDPDLLFVQGAAQNRVKTICAACNVRTECLAVALDNQIEYGVWGGMTERERRSLLRRRPYVSSWRELLMAARRDYGRVDPVAFVRGA